MSIWLFVFTTGHQFASSFHLILLAFALPYWPSRCGLGIN